MIMLTAGRCAEVVGMCWGEIDTDAATWTVPRERMKSGREHRVPLSPQAMQLLDSIPRTSNPFVFPGQSPGSHVSGVSVRRVLHEYFRRTETVHGFRACFRQWAAECCPSFPREAAERALAHVVGSEVERAYMRSDLFEIRRQLMQAWADYLTGRPYQTAP
ncbi:MAG: tyrosine-type recombinase/integrase, partial [Sphaerochaetaceae bacterium]